MTAAFALKTPLAEPVPNLLVLSAVKTMYGGKRAATGDVVFVFAHERGLVARGLVETAAATPRRAGPERQTPRVDLAIRMTGAALRPLGRADLKAFNAWTDGRPETELNFKFYRQATDKLVGVSDAAAEFLAGFFAGGAPSKP